MEPPIGLIAGGGGLPVLEARGIRAAGRRVVGVGFRGLAEPELRGLCDRFTDVGVAQLGKWSRALRRFGARQAIMVGTVDKANMYESVWTKLRRLSPDVQGSLFWYRKLRRNRRSQYMLGAIADHLMTRGIELIDTTQYIPDHLAQPGVMTRRQPTPAQRGDIDFGWPVLMRMNDLDIGQAISVKDREVIAVEGMEGTSGMIDRTGALCRRGGWTLLKGPKPDKDMRFDVPTIGLQTIERLAASGAACLAVAAGKVILMDRPKLLEAADAAGIAVVGVESTTSDRAPE